MRVLPIVGRDPARALAEARRRAVARLSIRDRERLLEWNATASEYPRDSTIPDLFEDTARRSGDRIAIVQDSESLTYAELNRRANRVAHRLRAEGVGPDVVVGLCAERSLEMVIGLLGVLKAGGAYLPADPQDPQARIAAVNRDARPLLWLVQSRFRRLLEAAGGRALDLDAAVEIRGSSPPEDTDPIPLGGPSNLAYVLYTSGSSGAPKGVEVVHRGVVRLVRGVRYARLDPERAILQLAPLAFDASTFEIWGALLNGGRLVLAPPGPPALEQIGETIRRHHVTTLWLTAGLFHLMIDHRIKDLRPLDELLAGGDVLSVPRVRRVLGELPCRLTNGYGPTESTTFATCHAVTRLAPEAATVPIGRPIANTRVYVMDSEHRCVPHGEEGEICIGGDGLARGYRNRPERTRERFLPDPLSDAPEARLYRTGDRGRFLPDGTVEFLGRLDRQVKVSGFRVEPEEIEATLERHPSVAQAVVSAQETLRGEKRLLAHLVPRRGVSCEEPEIRRFLVERLPMHMVPACFVVVAELPLTPGGKLDRQALSALPGEPPASGAAPGSGELEASLLEIWRRALGRKDVGLDDNFFDAGGNSLALIEAHAKIRTSLGRVLPVTALFDHPSIRSLAVWMDAQPSPDRLRTLRSRVRRDRERRRPNAFQ